MTLEEAKTELEKFVKLKTSMRPAFVQPLLDAVEVVRCKDCKHWIKDGKICCGQTTVGEDESSVITGENDFCSRGERW